MCEEALLRVKGVISFTFQMALKRCTVRIRADLPTEVLLFLFFFLRKESTKHKCGIAICIKN